MDGYSATYVTVQYSTVQYVGQDPRREGGGGVDIKVGIDGWIGWMGSFMGVHQSIYLFVWLFRDVK